MTNYLLKSKEQPALKKYGTAREIWEHCSAVGYSGETKTIDGYPLPAGKGISLEKSYEKKTGAVRLAIEDWMHIESLIGDKSRFKSQASVMEYGLKALLAAESYGPVYATTPDGIKKFDSMVDFMVMKPFFDATGFVPLISGDKEQLINQTTS